MAKSTLEQDTKNSWVYFGVSVLALIGAVFVTSIILELITYFTGFAAFLFGLRAVKKELSWKTIVPLAGALLVVLVVIVSYATGIVIGAQQLITGLEGFAILR